MSVWDDGENTVDQLHGLVMLLRDVANSGVEWEAKGYVTVQIDHETWRQVRAFAAPDKAGYPSAPTIGET